MSQYTYKIATHIQMCLAQYSCGFEPARVRSGYASLDGAWAHNRAQAPSSGSGPRSATGLEAFFRNGRTHRAEKPEPQGRVLGSGYFL